MKTKKKLLKKFYLGHIIAPIISHSICNIFGLPSLFELDWNSCLPRPFFLFLANIFGFTLWFILLTRLTASELYI